MTMPNKIESGKSRLIKGALLYAWEELKTMNWAKLKALARILSGYFKMKYQDHKRLTSGRNRDYSTGR